MNPITIVAISDTHEMHRQIGRLPAGDVLVHAGDFTGRGDLRAVEAFAEWMDAQEHSVKIVVAGNHDLCFAPASSRRTKARAILERYGLTYLEDSGVTVAHAGKALRVWGSPRTPRFGNWAFMYDREVADDVWAAIPDDTDVLITHGPPAGVLDYVRFEHAGCPGLSRAVDRVRPRLHIFGHIHEGYGRDVRIHGIGAGEYTVFINAAICDGRYDPNNAPHVLEIP